MPAVRSRSDRLHVLQVRTMAHQTWTGVPGPDVAGWVIKWHARRDDQTLEFAQVPLLRVLPGSSIVVSLHFPGIGPIFGEVTGLCAIIELDEACSQALAGRHYLVAFNPDQRSNG